MKILLLCETKKHFDAWVKIQVGKGRKLVGKTGTTAVFLDDGENTKYVCFTKYMVAEKLRGHIFDKIEVETWVSEREMTFFNTFVRG